MSIDLAHALSKYDDLIGHNQYEEAERLLIYWIAEGEEAQDQRSILTLVNEQLGLYRAMGKRKEGLQAVNRALELLTALSLDESVSGAMILLNAATTDKAFGFAETAIGLYEKTRKIWTDHLEDNDLRFAGLYNNEGTAYAELGYVMDARRCYEKAIAILTENKGKKLDEGISYLNLADLALKENDSKEELSCLKKAKELLLSPENERNGYFAFCLTKCAPGFKDHHDEETAKELLRLAKDAYART